MNWEWEVIGKSGFEFFGRMSASLSHEIKNVLAVINENAGLLSDLAALAAKGRPMDPVRIENQAEIIIKQVQRADGVVRNMNRFAHSVDEFSKSVDLGEVLELVCAISSRIAWMRGVKVSLEPPPKGMQIFTCPFLLENLLWLYLEFSLDGAGEGKTISVKAEDAEEAVRVWFSGMDTPLKGGPEGFPGERGHALLGALGVEPFLDQAAGAVVLTVRKKGKS